MNRKEGFTLVELLAVIAILAILLAMFVPSLLNSVKSQKEDALNKMYDLIETAARSYVMDYDIDIPTIIQMEDLCETSYIDCPILNPETEEELNGYVFAGNDYFYGEDESIKLTVNFGVASPNQTFNESYAPGTTIELQDVSKESYEFLGWEVVEGNSVIKDNKLTIGTTSTIIKPKLVRYLNKYIKYLYDNEEILQNGLQNPKVTYNAVEYDTGIRYVGPLTGDGAVKNQVYFNCEPTDGTNTYGSKDYNYKDNCEIWRIIGVFEVEDGNGNKEKRIKLINTNSTFSASWDSSASGTNSGKGINQWGPSGDYAGADLMQLLNGYYIGKSESECKYNNASGKSGFTQTCTIESLTTSKMKPLTSIAKRMITGAVWDIYAVKYPSNAITDYTFASTAYLQEKGISTKYTGISECPSCSDGVTRTTNWTGLIGLMSVSDITYANGWLYKSSVYPWSISSYSLSSSSYRVWRSLSSNTGGNDAYNAQRVWPSVYLKSDIQSISGNGDTEPYILDI